VFATYVATDGTSIAGLLLGLEGTPLAGPVTLVSWDRNLYLPSLSLLRPRELAL
jgi:hypothetical protein